MLTFLFLKEGGAKMSQKYWTDLIEWQDTYSGGLQLINSRTLSTLNENPRDTVSVEGTISSLERELTFHFSGDAETSIMRWLGCVLVCQIPEIGIEDTIKKLHSYYKFYSDITDYQITESESTKSIGVISSESESPNLVIVD